MKKYYPITSKRLPNISPPLCCVALPRNGEGGQHKKVLQIGHIGGEVPNPPKTIPHPSICPKKWDRRCGGSSAMGN